MSDYVSFADAFALETDVTIEKASDNIQIVPLCEESFKLNVAESSPEKKSEGVFRDSSIKLDFNYAIEEEELEKIQIEINDGELNGKSYFSAPVVKDKKLIFAANFENRIQVFFWKFKNCNCNNSCRNQI